VGWGGDLKEEKEVVGRVLAPVDRSYLTSALWCVGLFPLSWIGGVGRVAIAGHSGGRTRGAL
jgi:hypothetical protein